MKLDRLSKSLPEKLLGQINTKMPLGSIPCRKIPGLDSESPRRQSGFAPGGIAGGGSKGTPDPSVKGSRKKRFLGASGIMGNPPPPFNESVSIWRKKLTYPIDIPSWLVEVLDTAESLIPFPDNPDKYVAWAEWLDALKEHGLINTAEYWDARTPIANAL